MQSQHLSSLQNTARFLYQAPEGSLFNWGVKSIDWLNKNEKVLVNTPEAFLAKRVIVAAMPVFAILDALIFVAGSAVHLCLLKPGSSIHDLVKSSCAVKLFFASIPAIPVGMVSPKTIYKTNADWEEIMQRQCAEKLENTISLEGNIKEKQENFSKVIVQSYKESINDPEVYNQLLLPINAALAGVPWDQDREGLVVKEYAQLFSHLLVALTEKEISLKGIDGHHPFHQLASAIIQVRKPALREQLLKNFLQKYEADQNFHQIFKPFDQVDLKYENQKIAAFLIAQLTHEIEENMISLLNASFFKDNEKTIPLISVLLDLTKHKKLTHDQKSAALKKLIKSYIEDQFITETIKERNQLKKELNSAKKPKGKAKKFLNVISKSEKRLAFLKGKTELNPREKKELEQLPKKIEDFRKKLEAVGGGSDSSEKVKELQEKLNDLPRVQAQKDPFFQTFKAIDHLKMFLSLKDENQLLEALNSELLFSDNVLIGGVIETIVGRKLSESEIKTFIQLQRPDLLIHYHSRLNELEGNERKLAKEALQRFIEAILNGNLDEIRHKSEENPHLRMIYDLHPEIQSLWKSGKRVSIKELVDEPSKKYQDCFVIDTNDPCDLFQQSSPVGSSCLDADGRIYKIKGLLGYMLDGKTHTILVKDRRGNVFGHTRLQLMFDRNNNTAVLYQDDTHLPNLADGDNTAKEALRTFCQQKADELGHTLVTDWELALSNYDGTVESIGSSAPFDYVNSLRQATNGIYKLGSMTVIN